MQIDSFTIMVAGCSAVFLFGAAFLYFWRQERASNWLAWWIAPFFLGSLGLALFIPRGQLSDLMSIGLANAVLIVAFALVWQGARVFNGRKPSILAIALPVLLWSALCLAPGFMADTAARIVAVSSAVSVMMMLAASEFWRGRSERLPSRSAAILVLVSFALCMLARIALVHVLPFPVGALPMNSTWVGIINFIAFAHVGAFVLLMVSLTKERREAQQRQFAMLDPLTGLMNRRAFISALERVIGRRRHGRESTALMVLDLDGFKQVNDQFGHDVGDRVLVAFARVAGAVTRPTDQLYRMGGEEFCFILPDTGQREAIAIAERVRLAFAAETVDVRGVAVGTTVSIGIALTDYAGFDLEVLRAGAAVAVYEAKARGRNRVVVADPSSLLRPEPAPQARQVFA